MFYVFLGCMTFGALVDAGLTCLEKKVEKKSKKSVDKSPDLCYNKPIKNERK